MKQKLEAGGSHRKKSRTPFQLVRDYALYLLISVGLIVSIVWMAKSGVSDKAVRIYLDVFFSTILVFGILIPAYQSLWKEPTFWLATLTLLIAYVVIWTLLITQRQLAQWRVGWVMYLAIPEMLAMTACGEWLKRFLLRKARRGIAEMHSSR